jgi:hypothetical protein
MKKEEIIEDIKQRKPEVFESIRQRKSQKGKPMTDEAVFEEIKNEFLEDNPQMFEIWLRRYERMARIKEMEEHRAKFSRA